MTNWRGLLVIVIAGLANVCRNVETIEQIKILACAAVSKRIGVNPKLQNEFAAVTKEFSERINYEPSQTRNFVNLMILNKCNKKIKAEVAAEIIRARAETGDINDSYNYLLDIGSIFNEYASLEDHEKRELFTELGEIKENLKGITETLSKMNENPEMGAGIGTGEANNSSNSDSGLSFLTSFFRILSGLLNFIQFSFRDNLMLLWGISVFLLFLLLSNCKRRRRKIINKTE